MIWLAVVTGSLLAFGQKVFGYLVPGSVLQRPVVRTAVALMPVSLLAALVCVQTFGTSGELQVDARVAGVCAATLALLLRAPFWVVVLVAAAVTAAVRALA